MTDSLNVAVADDVESIHVTISHLLKEEFPGCRIEHYYDTEGLKDRLVEDPGALDLLLLDVYFAGGETGIEALPEVRSLSAGLPIILLTGESDPLLIREAFPYRIDYLRKPVDPATLVIHVQQHIDTMTELILLEERIQELSGLLKAATVPGKNSRSGIAEPHRDLAELVRTVFPDITFAPRALRQLKTADRRVFRVLKAIDWKMPVQGGARIKKNRQYDAWELRFSGSGRIFVRYPKGAQPEIVHIDYNPPYHR